MACAALENAFRFVLWAQELRTLPTAQQIVDRWECSRATAYRYRAALADARCELAPVMQTGGGVPNNYKSPKGHTRRYHLCVDREVA